MKSKIAEIVMLFAIFCLFVFSVLEGNKILVLLTVLAFALMDKNSRKNFCFHFWISAYFFFAVVEY